MTHDTPIPTNPGYVGVNPHEAQALLTAVSQPSAENTAGSLTNDNNFMAVYEASIWLMEAPTDGRPKVLWVQNRTGERKPAYDRIILPAADPQQRPPVIEATFLPIDVQALGYNPGQFLNTPQIIRLINDRLIGLPKPGIAEQIYGQPSARAEMDRIQQARSTDPNSKLAFYEQLVSKRQRRHADIGVRERIVAILGDDTLSTTAKVAELRAFSSKMSPEDLQFIIQNSIGPGGASISKFAMETAANAAMIGSGRVR